VICEELQINDYVAVRNLRTANRIHIKKKGHVVAAVWCEDLLVDGKLKGDAISLGTAHITKKAQVLGGVRAMSLRLDEGADVSATMRIGPEHIPEHEAKQERTPTEVLDELESRGRSGSR
jgi:cytoskeletal protein CcmA (bactofilin family)